ncbi:hypothetical protein ABID58_002784 [Bradyrhizobium sp. S3.2.6]
MPASGPRAPAPNVGRGARNQAGDTDAAEQRCADICGALRHQLAIGAVTAPGHAVGDHRRQQRFDGREQRKRDRIRQHRFRLRERERRQRGRGQFARDAAETTADGFDWQRQCSRRDRRERDRDQDAGPGRPPAPQARDDGDADESDAKRGRIDGVKAIRQRGELRHELARLFPRERDACEIAQLARKDDHGDTGGEADRDGIGDELDVGADAQQARGDQHYTCHHGGEDDAVDAMPLRRHRDQHDEGARGAADLEPAAAEQRHDEAADNRSVEPAIRCHAGGNRNRHRQRKRDDRDREARKHIGAEIREAIAFAPDGNELWQIEFGKGRLTKVVQLACVFARDAHAHNAPMHRAAACSGATVR